jgi:hypothetical protein
MSAPTPDGLQRDAAMLANVPALDADAVECVLRESAAGEPSHAWDVYRAVAELIRLRAAKADVDRQARAAFDRGRWEGRARLQADLRELLGVAAPEGDDA